MRCSIVLSFLFALSNSCYAVHLPFHVQFDRSSSSIGARSIPIYNNGNAQYIANVTLGGVIVPVMLDTGRCAITAPPHKLILNQRKKLVSSDLWVNFPDTTPSTTDLGKSLSLGYAVGSASGLVTSFRSLNRDDLCSQATFTPLHSRSTISP